ncbi:MAG: septal ring lytic transglycosylase RlpA family protein [Bryobacteraceae bacterium]|jgi:rare lipoprotein A
MRRRRYEFARGNAPAAFCALIGVACALALAGCAKRHIAHLPAHAVAPKSHETGLASWYGHPYDGRQAANGEIYDMETLVAAHRTLPFGTWVRVTNLDNKKTVDVRIIDRGPFVGGRIIDLSHAAAEKIDLIGVGVAKVRLDILSTPPVAQAAATFYAVQVGAFADRARAEQVRSTMEQRFGAARLVLRQSNPPLWRVLVGRENSEAGAEQLEQRLGGEADHCFVVRLDHISAEAGR